MKQNTYEMDNLKLDKFEMLASKLNKSNYYN